ncbi:CheY-like chemotaxis protein [Caulobacter rhizosphaerae]|jgi:CheY-like chemotaxis protein|uniref:CheY-like chemotaxis protein n=1 Tax=Caulobacter rhizosphaerae TaxID=2010972 RepID=A0ABU1MTM9_9CAUL|nr:response regulator [Caulobacter rhizosphaerae]MDR6529542.1 CheY-like chemotaxis protein [Caulobacter rhizosphaerae]
MADASSGPVRILVVEDEYLLADDLADALTALGAQVIGPVGVLAEALALAETAPINGAILDINLHGQMVFPLADVLAAKGVPYVFATGYGQESLPEAYQGVPTLSKPVNAQALQPLLAAARAG